MKIRGFWIKRVCRCSSESEWTGVDLVEHLKQAKQAGAGNLTTCEGIFTFAKHAKQAAEEAGEGSEREHVLLRRMSELLGIHWEDDAILDGKLEVKYVYYTIL